MRSPADGFEFNVPMLGAMATECLNNGAAGWVSALFDSTFYVAFGGGLVCIGNDAFEASPPTLPRRRPGA